MTKYSDQQLLDSLKNMKRLPFINMSTENIGFFENIITELISLRAEISSSNSLEEDAINVIHDAYYDIVDLEPSDYMIEKIHSQLPSTIILSAKQWGWNDTEVREKVYKWIEEHKADLD